jgi:hypothetical protein
MKANRRDLLYKVHTVVAAATSSGKGCPDGWCNRILTNVSEKNLGNFNLWPDFPFLVLKPFLHVERELKRPPPIIFILPDCISI